MIVLISYTTNQFPIGGFFSTTSFRLRTCRNERLSRNQTAEVRRHALFRLERELEAELEKFATANSSSSLPSHL